MKLTICIIDDDLVSQFATTYSIEQSGHPCSIITCDSAEDCLETFNSLLEQKRELPDIILLDLVMGDMSGWDFLERFKQIPNWPKETAIYILSSFTNSKDRRRAKEHTLISGYFDKPVSNNDLDSILSSMVK
ncbi:two-component system response regulator [Muriicola sp. Z0-33]|uniref:response regulator n=1 Tax=Muriicola sp. Z0-33 TaxID=2816957 RepID=UPI0022375FF7|nr:response regulator [Muriicola sp. Z0-33]MCW5516703.1 response regulator [Muriicola sp. Z0-33]